MAAQQMTGLSHISGYPRMGPKRELKFALEALWDKKSTEEDLRVTGAQLRKAAWERMKKAGVSLIPSNTFSFYDQVLDTSCLVGAVPARYGEVKGEVPLDAYFAMARGSADQPAMEMTKWFDTNYHYIVPELSEGTKFVRASLKAINEYKEAKEIGIETVPVIIAPTTYLSVAKAAKDATPGFDRLSLLSSLVPIYTEVAVELAKAGAKWIQFDEGICCTDLNTAQLEALKYSYQALGEALAPYGTKILVNTFFDEVNEDTFRTLSGIASIAAIGLDLHQRPGNENLVLSHGLPAEKVLFAGIVDGRNIWANDLAASIKLLQKLEEKLGEGRVVVSTSCSLLHTAIELDQEINLDSELKPWLAFANQKVTEVVALADALKGQVDAVKFEANAQALASRRASNRVSNRAVREQVGSIQPGMDRRATPVGERLLKQQEKLKLPVLPTTTIGSFPQTQEIRCLRRDFKAKRISEGDYIKQIKEEIARVIKLQEELDIDVLVHGEPERNDMVEYFGEQLSGFAFTQYGWVQSYGSRCVKPPIIYGDVSRPEAMTVPWSSYAQSLSKRPVKAMLTGPVTVLNWSFVRDDQPRSETCLQLALALRAEVQELEAAGITVIQIDEAALRERLPLHRKEWEDYISWAVRAFRITASGVKDTTQIHTHMCYSQFNDIMEGIIAMDADVISIENSRSDERLLLAFQSGGVRYAAGIGPGVYDIHSPRVPSAEEMATRVRNMVKVIGHEVLWVNPDCGLKTRKYEQVVPALKNMVEAAKQVRAELLKETA